MNRCVVRVAVAGVLTLAMGFTAIAPIREATAREATAAEKSAEASKAVAAVAEAKASIKAHDLKEYVDFLASDALEGRAAGSRGNRAAAGYIVERLTKLGLQPAGEGKSYFQSFRGGSRNILAVLPGSDPVLAKEYVLVGAHYDHVGYGTQQNSFGPTGYIHNGADDNASGTAALLEIAEAAAKLPQPPARSILFAFWDDEENGLYGSLHYTQRPTVPLAQLKLIFNLDMLGRVRKGRVEVYGTRTASGLQQLVAKHNHGTNIWLDYNWDVKEDSDHYPFYAKGVPFLMLHSGLHDDYHRPSDDAEKINHDGLEEAAQLTFATLVDAASRPKLSGFRTASRNESNLDLQSQRSRYLPPAPPRLGVTFTVTQPEDTAAAVARVFPNTPAQKYGLKVGDRILKIGDVPTPNGEAVQRAIFSAPKEVTLTVLRSGATEPESLAMVLDGTPLRLGVSWRFDDAQPESGLITRVVPGSPASQAGLRAGDRVFGLDGREFRGVGELIETINQTSGQISFDLERFGRVLTLPVELPEMADKTAAKPAADTPDEAPAAKSSLTPAAP